MRNLAHINGKILDRLGERVTEKNLPPRSDMQIVDIRPIDSMKANVLIAYETQVGTPPTLSQLERFVSATFDKRIIAHTETAQIHEADSAISVCLSLNLDTRPVTDATVMRRVATNGYFDEATGHVWQVVDNGTQKHLIRRTDDNIAEIIQARMERKSRKSATFAQVRQAAPMLSEGDTVRFFDGVLPVVGKITSISDDNVSVSANGKSFSVARESVFNVVERAPSAVSGDKSTLEDYFSRAYGNPEYARKLVNKLNRDDAGMKEDSGWRGTVGDEG